MGVSAPMDDPDPTMQETESMTPTSSTLSAGERADIRRANRRALERFMGQDGLPWWEEGADQSGFAPDFLFQNPWTPPGLRGAGVTAPQDTREFFRWLQAAVTRFDVRFEKIHEMEDPYTFWMEYYGDGECSWGQGGRYEQLEVTFVRFDTEGRLKRYVEHYDPTRFLRSVGETVPHFSYAADRERRGMSRRSAEPDDLAAYIDRRRLQDQADEGRLDLASMDDAARALMRDANLRTLGRVLENGARPWWETIGHAYGDISDEFTVELPHFGHFGPVTYGPGEWQELVRWLTATFRDVEVTFRCHYTMEDPSSFWLEYYGEGTADWGPGRPFGHLGVSFVRFDAEGRLLRYREHFNPARLLEVAVPWTQPTFDYDADRVRHGLPPSGSRYVPMEEYVAARTSVGSADRGL